MRNEIRMPRKNEWLVSTRCAPNLADEPSTPCGKMRGNRRYYRGIARTAERFAPSLEGWFNFSHWHTDWHGRGNASWRARKAHLDALFTMFGRLRRQLAIRNGSFQCWVLVDGCDSAGDALYLHTPNPQSEFPGEIAGVTWDVEPPVRLRQYLGDDTLQFGRDPSGTVLFGAPSGNGKNCTLRHSFQ